MRAALGGWTFLAPIGYLNFEVTKRDRRSVRRRPLDAAAWRQHLPFEMTPGEGPARAGFQIAFEAGGGVLIRELNDNVKLPRSAGGGMRTAASVVVGQPCLHIRREPDIEMWARISALQNVDEALVSSHCAVEGKRDASGEGAKCRRIPGERLEDGSLRTQSDARVGDFCTPSPVGTRVVIRAGALA